MKLTIHRGTHEIGGTLIEIAERGTRILVDAGFPLFLQGAPIDGDVAKLPEERLRELGVLPPIHGLYAGEARGFDAVVISHAHIDHYGLLPWVNPDIPVYLSGGTAALIGLSQRFGIAPRYAVNGRPFSMYQPFSVGSIEIKPYLMDHSAFDAAAFEITAGGRTVQYTGDFRGHGRKAACLDAFLRDARREADALLIEGTMLGRPQEEVRTEEELEEDIARSMDCSGPVFFQCSSQNVDRLVTFYKACRRAGRTLVIDVYTANVLHDLRKLGSRLPAPDAGYDGIRVFYPWRLTKRIFDEIGEEFARRFSDWHISKEQVEQRRDRLCLMVRPSMLPDLARMPGLSGGRLLYSLWQGYREQPSQRRLEQCLLERGCEVLCLHSSGHARVEDLRRAVVALQPKMLIPVHGLFPERFGQWCGNVAALRDGEEVMV